MPTKVATTKNTWPRLKPVSTLYAKILKTNHVIRGQIPVRIGLTSHPHINPTCLQLVSRPSVPGNNKTAGAATTSVPGKRNAGRQSHVLNSNGHKVILTFDSMSLLFCFVPALS